MSAAGSPSSDAQDLEHRVSIARPQRDDLAQLRVVARRRNTRRRLRPAVACRWLRTRVDARTRQVRPRRANRPHHDGSRRDVADVRQLELHGAIEQAALERVDVSATESLRHRHGNRRASDRGAHQRRVLRCARQHDEQLNQSATDGIAKAIEPDVDDRLGGALVMRGDRREEDLVTGLEERTAERGFAGARGERATESGKHQRAEPSDHKRQRRRGRRDREAEAARARAGPTRSAPRRPAGSRPA